MNTDALFYPQEYDDEESKNAIHLVRRWVDKEIAAQRMEYRENYENSFAVKRKKLCVEAGLQKLFVPAGMGGFGWNSPGRASGALALAVEAGRGDASIGALFALSCSVLALFTMEGNSSEKLVRSIAPLFAGERLLTPAVVLPGAGFEGKTTPLFKGRSIHARAEASGDSFVISGDDLRPLFAGGIANIFSVVCAGKDDVPAVAIIPGDAAGMLRGKHIATTGLNACKNADITLAGVAIPHENLITRAGVVEELYIWINLLLGGAALGAGVHFFEALSDWGNTRVIRGKTIMKDDPLCASVLAETAEEIALARLLLYDLAKIIATMETSAGGETEAVFIYAEMIGARAVQGIMRAINRGMELMGSAGYSREWHVEKDWRDVKTIQATLCGVAAEAPVRMDIARFFYHSAENDGGSRP